MKSLICIMVGFVTWVGSTTALAQVVVYDNGAGFSGSGLIATASGTGSQPPATITTMFSDDIIFAPGAAGNSVTLLSFRALNGNTASVSVRPRIRFYADDNGGTAPGTFINGFTFNPVTIPANTVAGFNFGPAAGTVVVPGNGRMWAGILYDNSNGTTGTTATTALQMQNLGVGIFATYTVGSSTDAWFSSPPPASGSYLLNNPTGSPQTVSTSGSFGWAFQVPEPGSAAICGLAMACGLIRRRRAVR